MRIYALRGSRSGRVRNPGFGIQLLGLLFIGTLTNGISLSASPTTHLTILTSPQPGGLEERLGEILKNRILKRSNLEIALSPDSPGTGAVIRLGRAGTSGEVSEWCREWGQKLPDAKDPGPEGFLLASKETDQGLQVLAVGVDTRGLLYAVGELLRRFRYEPEGVSLEDFVFRSAPAYRWRGSSANQGGTMREATGARAWGLEDQQEAMFDHLFSGANTLYADGEIAQWLKTFDIMIEQGCRPNQLPGTHPEWRREGTEGGPYVCPSIPEARAALLEYWDQRFKEAGPKDVLRYFAGDPGGCRCDLCQPWGKTFVLLCAELSEIWLKYHPGTEIQLCNQDLTNEGDQAIFKYLNEEPRKWLTSMSYGPGSNALSTYFRNELREDLFTYPAHGPINRYLAYTLQSLPVDQTIVHYSDITHWISAQYQVENPEPNMVRVYGRRTFHQRPKAFYRIFHDIMPFSEGDIIYSEGYHDELHQHLWNRMLWDPHRSLDEWMLEHATYHFGKEAAPEMVQASYQLEENFESPLATNPGIDRYYQLVKSAGEKTPANLLAQDHRWRAHLQKAALDKFFQLKLQRETEFQAKAQTLLGEGLKSGSVEGALTEAKTLLAEPVVTESMTALLEEARTAGEETDRLFGIRNVGYFRNDLDLTGLEWIKKQVESLAILQDAEEQRAGLENLFGYEDPGQDGYYDDAGNADKQPHLTEGEIPWSPERFAKMLDPKNRPSANTFVYNREGPVVFTYRDLDQGADYRLKMTIVGVRMPAEVAKEYGIDPDRKLTQDILADEEVLAKELSIPQYTAQQYEFEVPRIATSDGNLRLTLQGNKGPGGFSASVVSEVWLMKKP